jgi:hypothetical protein
MAHRCSRIGPILLVRLTERLDATDCLALPSEARAACERAREPVTMVLIVPEDLKLPSATEREAFARAALSMRRSCQVIHVAIEGTGFACAAISSAFSGIEVYPGQPPLTMHATAEVALRTVSADLRANPTAVLKTARFQQMIG